MDYRNPYGVPDDVSSERGSNDDGSQESGSDIFDRKGDKDKDESSSSSESDAESEADADSKRSKSSSSSESDDEDDDDDKYVPFAGDVSKEVDSIRIDTSKVESESYDKRSKGKRPISDECVSKYRLGKIMARGRQAVIFEGCESGSTECPFIVRLAMLRDQGKSAPQYQKHHESFAGFERDVDVRRYLEDCRADGPFLRLVDAFICEHVFGIAVGPRLSGNLMHLLHRSNDPVGGVLPEIRRQVDSAVATLHQCGVAHRDISYQNILYSGDEHKFAVVLTDFEDAYIKGVTPIQTRENPERIFDAYKTSDTMAVQIMYEELRELANLFAAVKSNRVDAAKKSWNSTSSFVKSDLEHSYPEIRRLVVNDEKSK